MLPLNDTIYALASASGRAGVAVLRISGPKASYIIEQLAGKTIIPRQASLCLLRDPLSSLPIDRVLLLWFPAPHSFTGEDVLEIHSHGSSAVVEKLLSVLANFDECRLAEPGEYARRAFENGKMDLTAIEGLADLINAQTEGQRKQALRQSEGELGRLYENWRADILKASAYIEALIDFSDEEDIDETLAKQATEIVEVLVRSLQEHLVLSGRRGEQMRDGFRLVIAGAPNVGKSSLLNSLANREAAIVTSQAGTTRDVIEVHMSIGGFPVLIMDTAGIRETSALIEQEGISRSLDRLGQADLVLWLQDDVEQELDTKLQTTLNSSQCQTEVWRILSKADLRPKPSKDLPAVFDLVLSTKSHWGIEELIARLSDHLAKDSQTTGSPLITRARHRIEVEKSAAALQDFLKGSMADPELRAEDLRLAASSLGRLTGRIDVEELLGHIFGEFCIGK
ncbi:MAG: tRNA uridine-5-carboxymethylaminomethyl(34) synthesis GTPase MnmE [Hyphomicrobiaceae bacterium]|nr:tRNA uridine-5-carboxymethylaminomethyl(34) synthesis GTPase MnmE [Hyphomicrobiaceae bacterium]